jgi:hypothetical protein
MKLVEDEFDDFALFQFELVELNDYEGVELVLCEHEMMDIDKT